jgi:serine/threonine-protein kinase
MNASIDWSRVKALFAQARTMPATERTAWLAAQCGKDEALLAEVSSLLAADAAERSDFLSGGGARLAMPLLAVEATSGEFKPGTVIGPYRLLSLLGEGGMGRVFLAERADGQFQQQVALKLIRSEFVTTELRQRFLRERDTLARLAHPNIAQLHDGGVGSDGAPYFTLEFIQGVPITRWCDTQRLGIRARVQLLLKVCDAVQHAHQNLIVHRDLKPSNILVTATGEPKLLDFGIAKPLAQDSAAVELTSTLAHPMTPEYAAPEQVLGEPVTTATDVYALGVLLYLLLCGKLPYRRAALGQSAWIKAILEEAPEPLDRAVDRTAAHTPTIGNSGAAALAAERDTSPQALKRALRGDLERIVQRAMAKASSARYPTVNAMAADLRAFLDGRAISGGTRTYQLRKFMRRHWLPLGAAGVVLALIIAGALIVNADARKIEREAQTTAAVKDFLLGLFRSANPASAKGKQTTLRDVVDRGVQRLDSIPEQQVQLKAEMQNTLGTIYYHLGLHKEAAALHEKAFLAVQSRPQDTVLATAAERFEATDVSALGDNARAQTLADDALRRLRALASPPRRDLARVLQTAGWIAAKRKDSERASRLSDEAYALAQQPPADEEVLYLALMQKGHAVRMAHNDTLAADFYSRALSIGSKLFGADDQDIISTQQYLGTSLNSLGQYAAAQTHLQAALDSSQRVFGDVHSRTLRIEEVLGVNDSQWGHVREAAAHFAHMLERAEAMTPRDESVLAEIRLNYAAAIIDLGKIDVAEPLLVAVRDYLQQRDGSDPDEVAETLVALGYLHMLQGKLESAESEAREALQAQAAAHGADDPAALALLSQVLQRRGDIDGAISAGRQARDHAVKISGERSYDTAWAHYCYGAALAAAGQANAAEEEQRAALKSYSQLLPPDGAHPQSAGARLALGNLLSLRAESRQEGLRLVQQAVAMRDEFLGADDPRTREARGALANLKTSPH